MTVVTVTPNPALDITYTVDELHPGQTHRVRTTASRPGGKGLNVARVLDALGVSVAVTGIAGGAEGAALRERAGAHGLRDTFITAELDTRRTVTVVDDATGTATSFNEPGPAVDASTWRLLHDRVVTLCADADVVTVSGSLPPGVPAAALASLVEAVSGAGVPIVVDTSGPALLAAARARPSALKPNADELREATGIEDLHRAATWLRRESGAAVVVSLGAAGLLAVTGDGTWTARLPSPVTGNATGAGDSVVAALARGMQAGWRWPDTLRQACALSAATVRSPVAGEFDAASWRALAPTIDVEEIEVVE
ncbi:1-phosphofructokinase [Actinobacteria bacterium YIM 96077]|uniref:1-phosphofructokinase n=1 Tax=Phytoactinopolyspora halophila TaxID=1981511 RepID=A0A329R0J9_9ACTN|nr:hexose kinase [Phytoactinopolyspora halophila]AYY11684.1 1-phosphofructokinase [Actinobacteria bacterium YIM 96077]RAW17883.1 1-phosphofructokinase [Phytoactinopolyspora halophila]